MRSVLTWQAHFRRIFESFRKTPWFAPLRNSHGRPPIDKDFVGSIPMGPAGRVGSDACADVASGIGECSPSFRFDPPRMPCGTETTRLKRSLHKVLRELIQRHLATADSVYLGTPQARLVGARHSPRITEYRDQQPPTTATSARRQRLAPHINTVS